MKKLMCAAAALIAGIAVADVTSANIVGYVNGSTGEKNNFKTISFSDIGFNTADIQSIKISDGGAGMIGFGTELFSIWEGAPAPVVGSGFFYYDPMMDPEMKATEYYWGDEIGTKVNYSIAPGQGVVIECGADLTVTTAGEVGSEKVEFTTVEKNNFTGNPFPAEIDIQAIKISDGGVGSIGFGTELFSIWEGAPAPVVGSGFFYYDPMMDPEMKATEYYWGDEIGNMVTYPIPAGQGVVIECAAGLTVTIEPPYSL